MENKISDELFKENLVLKYDEIMNMEKNRKYNNGSSGFNNFVKYLKKGFLNSDKKLSKKELVDMNIELKKKNIDWEENQKWQKEMDNKEFRAFIKGEIVITGKVKFL